MTITTLAQTIIDEELSVLAETLASLREQEQTARSRLSSEETRARELTADYVATRRLEDKVMLASDESVSHSLRDMKQDELQGLGRILPKPYFARIVLEEWQGSQKKIITYKIGNIANTECRIIDWRKAPISKLYYEYKEGDEYSEVIQGQERVGKILVRNTLDIKDGILKKIICREGELASNGQSWRLVAAAGQAHRSRNAESGGELPDILSLITAEQFRLITEEATSAVLIQGIAGSGKTTVALHRLAWLLHHDNSDLQPKDCIVVVLNQALQKYISAVLPALNIHGVRIVTFHEWCGETLKAALGLPVVRRPETKASSSIRRLKSSTALLSAVEHYVKLQRPRAFEFLEKELPWNELPASVRSIFDKFKADTKAPLVRSLLELKAAIDNGASKINPSHPKFAGLGKAIESLRVALKRCQLYQRDLLNILADYKVILANDTSKLLDQDLIRQAEEHCRINFDAGLIDQSDDALLVRLIQLKTGQVYDQAGKARKYGHIVVDEVQDFSATDLSCIAEATSDKSQLTLVGDTAQSISEHNSFPGWDALRNNVGFTEDVSRFVSLKISHRSTLPIMRLAEHVSGLQRVEDGRPGRVPIWFKCRKEEQAVQESIRWLLKATELNSNTLTAVICPDQASAKTAFKYLSPTFGSAVRIGDEESFSFETGIVVTDAARTKGLEFFSVLIWDPSSSAYPDTDLGRNLLYVALTRAEENLCLVSFRHPSKCLPDIRSNLVRGVPIGEEEEEAA